MDISYPDRVIVTRAEPGTQDPDTGAYTPGSSVTLYDGPGDVQLGGRALQRAIDGDPGGNVGALIFLQESILVPSLRPEDKVRAVLYEDEAVKEGRVRTVSRYEGSITVAGVTDVET